MDTLLFDPKRLPRPALRCIASCVSTIVISSLAMVHPVHAAGTVSVLATGSFYLPGSPTWTGTTPAAVCVAHPNFCGWKPGTLISSMTCGIVPGSASVYPSFCNSYTEPIVPLSSCPPNATGTPTPTNPTTCTCDAKFQPDAAGRKCVPDQHSLSFQQPLADVEPIGTSDFAANTSGTAYAQVINSQSRSASEI